MADRLYLHDLLTNLLESRNVYFDPPESVKIKIPAIRYTYKPDVTLDANDGNYITFAGYEVILIDYDPDSEYVTKLKSIQYSRFVNHYTVDGLHHWVFNLYI